MEKKSYIYILTNYEQTTLYIGVTNNLVRRTFFHKEKINKGFSQKYNLTKLVYYEIFSDITQAIAREKQLKGGSRQKKIDLINKFNPNWDDLYESIIW
ncbi:MAG: GIY-YIG nuclease family protein [Candidatus Gastranaerophilaceae bacterium]